MINGQNCSRTSKIWGAPPNPDCLNKERSSCKEKDLTYYTAFILREMNRKKLMDLSSKDFLWALT